MGKRKRKQGRPLTHEEIWDDSALIESWNAAAEEYKLYRSIQANGEDVEQALQEYQANETTEGAEEGNELDYAEPTFGAAGLATRDHELGADVPPEDNIDHADEQIPSIPLSVEEPPPKRPREVNSRNEPAVNQTEAGPGSGAFTGLPNVVLGTAETSNMAEDLKNLMTAWYFAGYYTGLYQGRRQANP